MGMIALFMDGWLCEGKCILRVMPRKHVIAIQIWEKENKTVHGWWNVLDKTKLISLGKHVAS